MALSQLRYREHRPSPALRVHVRAIWELSGPCDDPAPQRLLPDGSMSLWFNFGAPLRWAAGEGRAVGKGRALLLGELRRSFEVASDDALDVVGVSFWTGHARTFVDAPLREVVDRLTVDPPLSASLTDALGASLVSAEPVDRVALVDAALVQALATRRGPSSTVRHALALLDRDDDGPPRVASIASRVGLSPRQLERRFVDEVGIAPKALASVLRFRRALHELRARDVDVSDVASRCGYVDQSHLIRDFTRFTGASPRRFAMHESPRARGEWLARAARPS